MDARKIRYERDAAIAALRKGTRVIASQGKKVVVFDMQAAPPDDDTLAKNVIGRSGCLRAPSLKVGDTWLVGFGEAAWTEFFDA